jgi:serine/threonine protein kinase
MSGPPERPFGPESESNPQRPAAREGRPSGSDSSSSSIVGYPETDSGEKNLDTSDGVSDGASSELETGDGSMATQTVFGPPAPASVKSRSQAREGKGRTGLALGTRLGEYVLERRLGIGGMGEVFAARHVASNELIALKTLSSTSATRLYRFKREFRVLADVAHRNLIRLHELVVPDGKPGGTASEASVTRDSDDSRGSDGAAQPIRHVSHVSHVGHVGHVGHASQSSSQSSVKPEHGLAFFTMELLDGEPFVAWVRAKTPVDTLTPAVLERLEVGLRQLIEGVHHLHGCECIHRDLKPSNVLVTAQGRVVVLDFGLVSELSDPDKGITRDGQLLGTPSYMAPEQATGQRVARAADYYAIGVMLYEALTGHLPFRGSMLQQLVEKQSGEVPDPRDAVEGVPDWLGNLCVRLLAREPESRPSGQELLDHVRAAQVPASESAQVFVGRRSELASLRAAVHELRERRSAVIVHLRGRSGNGKSTLARRFRAELREDEIVVLHGRCREREAVPYKGVDAVIDSLSAYLRNLPIDDRQQLCPSDLDALVRVFPVLDEIWDSSDEQLLGLNEARSLGWSTLRKLLERVAERQPIVMHIDDFQWADLDSVQLLQALVRPPESPAIMLLVSYRSETQGSDALRALLADEVLCGPDVRTINVEALTRADAQELASGLLAADSRTDIETQRARAAAIALRSGGSPLFIAQMAFGGGALESSDADIDDVIVRRLSELDSGAQRLLEVVAVFGGPMPAALALELCPRSSEAELATLCELSLLVRERDMFVGESDEREGDRVEAAHDRVREVVLARLPEAERRRLHLEIGDRLLAEARGSELGELGELGELEHLPKGDNQPEEREASPHGNRRLSTGGFHGRDDNLFTLVNHLDAGMGTLDELAELADLAEDRRLELARLNYAAGKRALESTAWIAARRYLGCAHQLIEPWLARAQAGEGHHQLCVAVVFARAQAEIALENPDGDAAIKQVLGWSLAMHDYCRIAQWYAWHLFPTARWGECVEFGREVLPKLGFPLPRRMSWPRALLSYLWGWRAILKIGLERIRELPAITDERVHAGIDIIMITCAQARPVDLKLHIALMGWHGRLLAKHGFHDGAPVALTNVALSAAALGNTTRAQTLVEVARELPTHRNISILAQAATQSIEVWALPIFQPARAALARTEQVYARACEVAPKSQIGAIMVALAFTQYLASVPLPEFMKFFQDDAARHEGLMISLVQDVGMVVRRSVESLLRGRTHGEAGELAELGEGLSNLTDYYVQSVVPVLQAMLEVFHGDLERGWMYASKLTRSHERQIGPIWLSPAHAMVSVICMTERWASSSAAERRHMAGVTRRHRATVRSWAGRCAQNYGPMAAIVEAEIAGRAGKHDTAVTEFERARTLATAGQLTWLVALASERLAKLAERRGHATLARAALDDAREAYASWGATAVVRRFERERA